MAVPAALSGPWNPLRVTGTAMPPNLLLMGKVLAVALLCTGHVRILPEPFLPFVPGLDQIVDPAVFRVALQTTVVAAAAALLLNRRVRVSALVLGGCMLLAVVSSRAYYGNNKTFVGLLLVLAALSDVDRPAYLVRWQLALVYFGAALNKLLDPDWQSGLFFEHWAGVRLHNPVYIAVADWLPPLVVGKVMCWGTIAAEFAASIGLLIPRLVPVALWINILFQVGLLEFTGDTFTLFFYAMQAAILAFIAWPERLDASCDGRRFRDRRLRRWLKLLDPDGLQHWTNNHSGAPLCIIDRGRVYAGFAAIQRLLLFSPVLWLVATALLALAPASAGWWWRRGLVAAVLIFFLPVVRPVGEWLYRFYFRRDEGDGSRAVQPSVQHQDLP
jgi:hypothetical protein